MTGAVPHGAPLIEVCVDTPGCARAAVAAGAARLELCSALALGGLTPSRGLMVAAAALAVPVMALIRPRDGDFLHDDDELAIMETDIADARRVGLAGVVIGALTADRRLDTAALDRLCAAGGDMQRTLHRAFDLCANPFQALEQAIDLGFDRILTSGGARRAPDAAALIGQLVERANGRIEIMAGGGITPQNATALVEVSGVATLHASCGTCRDTPELTGFGFAPSGGARRFDPGVFAALGDAVRGCCHIIRPRGARMGSLTSGLSPFNREG